MKASPGRIFPEIIVLPIILGGGAGAVLFLVDATGQWLFSALVSFLGCYLATFVPVIVAWSIIIVNKGWDDRPPPQFIRAIPFVLPMVLGAGLYYLIHYILAFPLLVSASKFLGGLLIFVLGWGLWTDMRERPDRYKWGGT